MEQLGEYAEYFYFALAFALFFLAAFFAANALKDIPEEIKEEQEATGANTLGELYINMSPQTFLLLRLAGATLAFFLGFAAVNPVAGIMLAAGAWVVPGIMLGRMKMKRLMAIEEQLVDALEMMGNALKSGLTLPQAFELIVREFPAPISQEFNLVLSEYRLGKDFNEALSRMSKRLNSLVVEVLVTGVAITKRCGGDLTEIFGNIAQTIRDQARINGKLQAATAQGRFQGLILGIMPFALIVVLYFVDRQHVETLFGYTLGIWALCLTIAMVVMAQLWIRKLMDIDV